MIRVLAAAGLLAAWRRERGPALLLTAWALTPPLVLAALVAAGSFATRRYLVTALPAVAVYAGPSARGLTTFSAPPVPSPTSALPDPLLARDRLASDTVDGVEIPPGRQRAAVAGAPRLWAVATRDGRALEGQATIDRVTAGRAQLEQQEFGGVVVQRWGPLEP